MTDERRTTPPAPLDLDALDALAVTKGVTHQPWSVDGLGWLLRFGNKNDGAWNDYAGEVEWLPDSREDAALIVAAVNALPALVAEVRRLRGITPELPPHATGGDGLLRYGLRYNGPTVPLTVPLSDGYWTPWHLADAALVAARAEATRERERAERAVRELNNVADALWPGVDHARPDVCCMVAHAASLVAALASEPARVAAAVDARDVAWVMALADEECNGAGSCAGVVVDMFDAPPSAALDLLRVSDGASSAETSAAIRAARGTP